jgi:hypothetical protein
MKLKISERIRELEAFSQNSSLWEVAENDVAKRIFF